MITLPQASVSAPEIDNLIWLIAWIVGVWFVAAEVILLWLLIKFRAKDGVRSQYVSGEEKHQKRWVSYPHYAVLVFDVVIVIAALRVWDNIKINEPTPEETVRVIAQQWAWTFVHPGPDGKLGTDDDIRTVEDLYVQVNRTYRFELHSRDVLHSFSIPVFRLKQDAVPGRMISGWFRPTITGNFDIQCAEICGIGHGLMPGQIHVQTPAEHANWEKEASGAGRTIAALPLVPVDEPAHAAAPEAGGAR